MIFTLVESFPRKAIYYSPHVEAFNIRYVVCEKTTAETEPTCRHSKDKFESREPEERDDHGDC